MLSAIVAASENNVIGRDNGMLWHLSDDLKHFRNTTRGHHVIAGRKTFESQGKPLPGRTNIIVTRNIHYRAEGCIVAHSLEEALRAVQNDDEPFIIGGEQIYRMTLPRVERIYLTRVHAVLEGDAFFPELDPTHWRELSRERYEKNERNDYPFSVYVLERIVG
jgi:dihydrofolate reductase